MGLINTGNSCFLNAVLQCLLSVEAFHQTCVELRQWIPETSDWLEQCDCSLLRSFLRLVGDEHDSKNGRCGTFSHPLAPEYFWKSGPLLTALTPGSQEDAQELLMIFLDGLHLEASRFLNAIERGDSLASTLTDKVESEEWLTVDRRGRQATVRTHATQRTFILTIFGGYLHSELHRRGSKRSITKEPFLILSIDIADPHIRTIHDAIHEFMKPESLDHSSPSSSSRRVSMDRYNPSSSRGYFAAENRHSVSWRPRVGDTKACLPVDSVSKHTKIDSPPPQVLILHLKRFRPTRDASMWTKLGKYVTFPEELQIETEWIANSERTGEKNRVAPSTTYRIASVVTHLGDDMMGGHYITDVLMRTAPAARWFCCDDGHVSATHAATVLARHAYLLIYQKTSILSS